MTRHKKQLESVNVGDYWVAHVRWRDYWRAHYSSLPFRNFNEYLGIIPPGLEKDTFQARHHIARKIRLLNSDHYIAFLNAYKARKSK